ncbi:MAG: oxygen-independent coproporphyrinogen III oxidase [Nitrospinaceae bacterium]|jgi:oxygen-independent coproporphyrinogen III oxidase|nr:oxygen-independent coproporphyrinogen III oxidase [Nitrospina sp.]MBT5870035.1 oxygen-independent coproporphyrinogen III oxidase [Nitrospinaceae bacterium]
MIATLSALKNSLIRKYPLTGPYYTSFPAVGQWSPKFKSAHFIDALDSLIEKDSTAPISLYLHYPFCPELCTYCCCYVVISNDQERMDHFSEYLLKEVDLLKNYFEKKSITPNIKEIHLGGGSPNVMSEKVFEKLVSKLSTLVDISTLKEFALEIDVRTVDFEKMRFYSEIGINRVSFGVQDFDSKVQEAVNRVQPTKLIKDLLTTETRRLFQSINFDIMWGLPYQSRESLRKTIQTTIDFSPDRITFLHYGHYPEVYKHQGKIDISTLPDDSEKMLMNLEAIKALADAGYEKIGLDHFAKKDDELVKWKKEGRLVRSFIGYPGDNHNLIGLGPSGLSSFNNLYFQNTYGLSDYYQAVDSGTFSTFRGFKLSPDLEIRREIIYDLINYNRLDFKKIESRFGIDFRSYFSKELNSFSELIADEMMSVTEASIEVTFLGENFVRHICMVFDVFLQKSESHKPSSRKDEKLASA